MSTYTGDFELRRMLMKCSRVPAGGFAEDVTYMTFHLAKLTGGSVDSGWVTADYTQVEARFDTLWTSLKTFMMPHMSLAGYIWYKDGPAWSPADRANGPSNPSVRTTARAVAGTDSTSSNLPPQCAVTVTEVTSIRKRYGRLYVPAIATLRSDADGRVLTTAVTSILGWFVTAYNGCRADGKQPVVWSRERSAHAAKDLSTIPFHPATAYSVDSLRIDNTFDIVRSRRYGVPTSRQTTALT